MMRGGQSAIIINNNIIIKVRGMKRPIILIIFRYGGLAIVSQINIYNNTDDHTEKPPSSFNPKFPKRC